MNYATSVTETVEGSHWLGMVEALKEVYAKLQTNQPQTIFL